jgi:hypothetical protein
MEEYEITFIEPVISLGKNFSSMGISGSIRKKYVVNLAYLKNSLHFCCIHSKLSILATPLKDPYLNQ